MMTKNPYPILEFDDNKTAKLNPSVFVSRPFDTDKMVITFFPEVVDALIAEKKSNLTAPSVERIPFMYTVLQTPMF